MLDATFSPKSSALMKIAVNALENCQPFTELPKDKYDKWKIMDLIVTPRAMGRLRSNRLTSTEVLNCTHIGY